MNQYKFFVTGGSGMLGSALCFELGKSNKVAANYHSFPLKSTFADFTKLDLMDFHRTDSIISAIKPDFLIHTAALTDVDACEENPELARRINVDVTKNLARLCGKHRIKMIHISTDYVFDGKKGNYTERDIPQPLNIYAKTKYEGELAVKKALTDYLILRTSIFGWNLREKKSFVEWIIDNLSRNKPIKVVNDQFTSMIFVNDLAKMIEKMAEKNLSGIYNIACHAPLSKYRLAIETAKTFSFNFDLINEITSEELMKTVKCRKAERPKNVSLNVSKIEKTLSQKMPEIPQCLKHMRIIEKEFKESFILEDKSEK